MKTKTFLFKTVEALGSPRGKGLLRSLFKSKDIGHYTSTCNVFPYGYCTNKDSYCYKFSSASLCITRGGNFGSPLLIHYTKHRNNKKEFKECAKTAGFRSAGHIL